MRIGSDEKLGLLYLWLRTEHRLVARTETVTPGVFADFDDEDRLLGIEIFDEELAREAANGCEVVVRPS